MKDLTVKRIPGSKRIYLTDQFGEIEYIQCQSCSTIKTTNQFFKHRGRVTKHQSYCKPCDLEIRSTNRRKAAK